MEGGKWSYGNTRSSDDYQFTTVDGLVIEYSSGHGIFNDWENERHLELSKKDKETVNTILDQYIVGYNDQTP